MKLRIRPTPGVLTMLEDYAKRHGVSPEEAGDRLMTALENAYRFLGNLRFLGRDWQESTKLKRDPAAVVGTALTPDQLALLEKGSLKSGYADVYSNMPHGWRAKVLDKGIWRWLRNRPSPETAAWERYLFLQAEAKASNEPAANTSIQETYLWLRSQYPDRPEADLRREAEEMEALRGK